MTDFRSVSSIILNTCSPGSYYGKEAHSRLNQIAENLHLTILDICESYSKISLLTHLYDKFDEACFYKLNPSYWRGDENIIRIIEAGPSIFRYLVEAALVSKGKSTKEVDDRILVSLIRMAYFFLQICHYSDYLFYNNFEGGFTVSDDGKIDFMENQKINRLKQHYLKKIRLRELKILRNIESGKRSPGFKELAKSYDEAFNEKYGIKLSNVAEVIETIVRKVTKKLYGSEKTSYKTLIKKVKVKTGLPRSTVENAISIFELDDTMLTSSWKYYKIYNITPSVSRQPIIHASSNMRKSGLVIFGPSALVRALSLLFSDIEKGIVDLGEFTKYRMQQRGYEFERTVRNLLREYGFNVAHITNTPSDIGDIDAVAYHEYFKTLFVIEAKSPKMDLSVKKMRWQQKRSYEWGVQLKKKVEWVKNNIGPITKQLAITKKRVQIQGMIVTEVPVYFDDSLPFRIFTIDEFELLIKGRFLS